MAPLEPLNVVGSDMAGLTLSFRFVEESANEEIEVFRFRKLSWKVSISAMI